MKLPREDGNYKMDENCLKNQKLASLFIIIASCCFLLFTTKAHALVYCVWDGMMGSGCSSPSAGTCTGGTACGAPCNMAPNNICPTIADALTCIDNNNDANAVIRVGTGTHDGPGNANAIDNTAGAAQTTNVLGGFASNCVTRTINPTNTIVEALTNERVFRVNNTTNFSLNVTLEGLTITGGDPVPNCAGQVSGGGVCVSSTAGTGGVTFTSSTNIYDGNSADASGGGLAVIGSTGGNVNATITNDTYTNNSVVDNGGGLAFISFAGKTVDATVQDSVIGGDDLFPNGGNFANTGGGFAALNDLAGGTTNLISQGNLITNNHAGLGGGVSILGGGGANNVSFDADLITFNLANFGGGIYLAADSSTGPTDASISRTEIGNNTSNSGGSGIFAICVTPGNINLNPVVNNVIHNNINLGTLGGGAVAVNVQGASSNCNLSFVNNTISDNMAPDASASGGAILADSDDSGVLNWNFLNDIIYFNSAGGNGDQVALLNPAKHATIAIRFSDIRQGVGNTDIVGLGSGVGFVNLVAPNFDADPLFVDRFNNNYHIEADSPIGNAGTKTAIATVAGAEASPPSEDFDGVPRDISIGAFEPPPSPTPTPTGSPTPTPTPCTADGDCPAGFICSDFVEPDMGVCIPGCTIDHPCPAGEECQIPAGSDQGVCVVLPTPTPTVTPTPGPPTPTPPPPTPPNIATFLNAKNGKPVTLQSDDGTILSDVKPLSKKLDGCPEGFNGQFLSFPIGSFQYVISGINPGDEATLIIDLPPGTIVNSYFKFGPTPDNPQPHCYEFLFDGITGAQIFADNIVVHHVDGQRGDDDLTPNGVIVDPAAPALLSEEPPGTKGNGCSIAQAGSAQVALLNLLIPLVPGIVVGLRSLRRKKGK